MCFRSAAWVLASAAINALVRLLKRELQVSCCVLHYNHSWVAKATYFALLFSPLHAARMADGLEFPAT